MLRLNLIISPRLPIQACEQLPNLALGPDTHNLKYLHTYTNAATTSYLFDFAPMPPPTAHAQEFSKKILHQQLELSNTEILKLLTDWSNNSNVSLLLCASLGLIEMYNNMYNINRLYESKWLQWMLDGKEK